MEPRLSLMHGWIPLSLEVLAAITLVAAVGWRTRRWRLLWMPLSAACGAALGGAAYWYVRSAGIVSESAPVALWAWIAVTGLAVAALVTGWRDAQWWRRGLSLLSVPLSLACAGVTLNGWVGYVPTVDAAWAQLTSAPLPDQTDHRALSALQRSGIVPARGRVVSVNIDSTASGFRHRDELVYLPPAWFASVPPPPLPAVMMIGGEFNTPADWLRAGRAIETLDAFAAAHDGQGPVVVFVDSTGNFKVDTECVNGPRGNAADHLTKDVVPYLIGAFGVSAAAAQWAVVGFSAGGTCAVDLAVMHPDLFGSFIDIAGDARPNAGTTSETIDRLFGGSHAAWEDFDPSTAITRHGPYVGLSGLFVVSGAGVDSGRQAAVAKHNGEYDAAVELCGLGASHDIDCGITAVVGKHDWPSAATAFATTLPWLMGHIGTPVGTRPLPMRQQAAAAAARRSPTSPGR
ncbi:esterase family protein [Mycobacterium hodleri]|uniref:alpha/beta hydrolase n=1 Tax=Mycolicibacterium hodleri TaxID=49897 RepID=UPI0021F29F26|nr:alpha/beta hydrolase-fold protein [Mycolicibacterium hodleri]MCV7133215.1 esterase family protein [Mycolicibacterium hodleri]